MSHSPPATTYLPPSPPPDFSWRDAAWLQFRQTRRRPRLFYHLRLHAWRRSWNSEPLSCGTLGEWLVPWLKELGCTGVVLLTDDAPLDSFPAGTDSGDSPVEWMTFIDQLHRAGLSVLMDWHPRRLEHWQLPDVRQLLCKNALAWLEWYHLDGLRVDVSDPARYLPDSGVPELLAALTDACPERTLLFHSPMPVPGFDTSQEHSAQPLMDLFRGGATHLDETVTNGGFLALPVDTVPFLEAFSGSEAAARACYLAFLALPGGKLVPMGTELGQREGLRPDVSLDWHLLEQPNRQRYLAYFQTANRLFLTRRALWSTDRASFEGLPGSSSASELAFLRREGGDALLCLCNLSGKARALTLPDGWNGNTCRILLSSDEERFGGTGGCAVIRTDGRWQVALPPETCALLDDTRPT